ncbi:hypothetical protein VFPFJ_05610 [Purpureocillium lilacinum]|uniref:Uncharacterized protein n=1 Tax=Purpureocillium lilacinum TaxID=33203 RepID=A0A179HI05_PURLI|nr:hypothetical protein VFPFJ_05610 [Purpureocillium lilacinum]OAQ89201.1 hypothetical protein VFPFJ_05610 [Purpureocillium lilacinum]
MSTPKIEDTLCKADIIICKIVYCYGATALAARMLEPVAPRVDVARRWGHVITFMACYRLCQHHLPSRSVEAQYETEMSGWAAVNHLRDQTSSWEGRRRENLCCIMRRAVKSGYIARGDLANILS